MQGVPVVTYDEAYPDSPDVSDLEWIRFACEEGHVGLTHDRAIRRDEATVRGVFDPKYDPTSALILLRGDLSSLELAEMFLVVRTRIESMVHRYRKQRRAFIAIVRRQTRKGGREVIEVHRWKDKEEWEEMMQRKKRRR